MKKLFILLLLPVFINAQNASPITFGPRQAVSDLLANKADTAKSILIVNTLADLKNLSVSASRIYFLLGKDSVNDNKGGFYRYDSLNSDSAENAYMNTIVSNVMGVGRIKRIFARTFPLPGGILNISGGVKTYYCTGTTNSSGEITLNRTFDNTSGGTPIFSEIWGTTIMPVAVANGPAEAVQSYPKTSPTAANKTVTYGFYKANAVTITLGLLLTPVASIGAGTVVNFIMVGI